jgi:hypothetical protein
MMSRRKLHSGLLGWHTIAVVKRQSAFDGMMQELGQKESEQFNAKKANR